MPITRGGSDNEYLIMGSLKGDVFRLYKNGRVTIKHTVNKAQNDPDCAEHKESALKRLQAFVELINALPQQYVPLELHYARVRFNIYAGIYISYESIQPVHSLRAIQSVLLAEQDQP